MNTINRNKKYKEYGKDYTAFKEELNMIKNDEFRRFIIDCLKNVPSYFYEVPASSSGKYHPAQDLGEGGTVRHTKTCVGIGLDLLRTNQVVLDNECNEDYNNDIVIGALLLHDSFKNGLENSNHTVADHANYAAALVTKMYEYQTNNKYIEKYLKYFEHIKPNKYNFNHAYIVQLGDCILAHAGQWNCDYDGNVILPVPTNSLEVLVHLADYIASRKYIDYGFEI